MASAPAQLPTQRRSSPEQSSPTATTSDQTTLNFRPGEPQTIFENNPQNESDPGEGVEKDQEPQIGTNVPPLDINDDPSVKKCWICFSDSTEDTPESSPWRDPCPCALQAHEECLLDWIADIEAPKSPRQRGAVTAPKIECPQCKAEIKLERPRNYLVDTVNMLERLADKASFPGVMMVLGGVLWTSSTAWGVHSVYAVFGPHDGYRILGPWASAFTRPPVDVFVGTPVDTTKQILNVIRHSFRHWRVHLGLPLISPLLILSRTHLADSYLPMVPIVFFASQAHSPRGTLNFRTWPPSASFAFAVLPYVRSLYNFYYEKVWAEKAKQWLREVQPRAGGDLGANARAQDAGINAGDAAVAPPAGDGNIFEVRIDGGIFEDWVEEENMAAQAPVEGREEDPGAPGPDVQANRPEPQIAAAPPPVEGPAAGLQPGQPLQGAAVENAADNVGDMARGERRLSFSPTAVIETVLGALLFPTVAGCAGEILKLILPRSWTTVPVPSARFASRLLPRFESKLAPRGILSHQWARSIVGGCLFVICKDALMLYVRWKVAQMHRHRKVMDSPEKKKLKRSAGRAGEGV